ncbi:cytochrome P450 [Mycena galericulata]|nr:cytochrome P450 [Mycena galericulata]
MNEYLVALQLIFLVFLTVLYFRVRLKAKQKDTDNIPSLYMGLFKSWIAILNRVPAFHTMIERGYQKFRGGLYQHPQHSGGAIFLVTGKYIGELVRAPDNIMSLFQAVDDFVQSRWIFGPQVLENPYHAEFITKLSRDLDVFFPSLYEEVVHACDEKLMQAEDAQEICALPFALGLISRISNRAFLGLPTTRCNSSRLTDPCPRLALRYLTRVNTHVDAATKLLGPLIEQRKREPPIDDKSQGDLLDWVLQSAPLNETDTRSVTLRVLHMVFASLHTTAMTFTHTLYHIASKPEYVEPLQQEIAEVVHRYGWCKEGIDHMYKLDSFMKECARYSSLGSLGILRKCVQPFAFSDGIRIPSGASVAVPMACIHMDPQNYPGGSEFRGFRFISENRDPRPQDMLVSTGNTFLTFGRGRHTWYAPPSCSQQPGRFFAAIEMKTLMAHIISTHNVSVADGLRPEDKWYAGVRVPNITAKVIFRRREGVV